MIIPQASPRLQASHVRRTIIAAAIALLGSASAAAGDEGVPTPSPVPAVTAQPAIGSSIGQSPPAPASAAGLPPLAEPVSVYAPLPDQPDREDQINNGGVGVEVVGRYVSDYVFRGIDFSKHIDPTIKGVTNNIPGNAPNYQADAKLTFDLNKAPHPFIGVFLNIFNDDPVSRFQEVRPYLGADWTFRPFRLDGGATNFTYPEREQLNTSELWFRFTFDDSLIFHTEKPVLSPYFFAAFDVHRYWGWYYEWGIEHRFEFEDQGISLTPHADIAYVLADGLFAADYPRGWDVGWQHFDVGLLGDIDLNKIANGNTRYGRWLLETYLTYTGEMCNHLRSDSRLWGGAGVKFEY